GLCAIGSTLQGSLMYLMVYTRSDIAYAISIVSRYLMNPGKNHWEAVKWILNYLKGTADVGPSIEERAILFLEAQDRVKKGLFLKGHNLGSDDPFQAQDHPFRSLDRGDRRGNQT
ncbi:hypothetical protein Tco_0219904, partial [Tanacetum coccineum]